LDFLFSIKSKGEKTLRMALEVTQAHTLSRMKAARGYTVHRRLEFTD